jgi:hypothetical protein
VRRGTRRRRRRGHRYATSLHSSPSPSTQRHSSWRWVARSRNRVIERWLAIGLTSHSSRYQPSLAKRHSPQRRHCVVGLPRGLERLAGAVGFSSAQLRGVVALQVRISRGSETVVASAGCFSRRHRAGGLLRFVASAEAASPLLAIVALIAGVTTLTIGEMCTLGGRVRIRRRAGAFASTWAIPDAAQHGPRAATNGGSCARHRCRRPRRAGRLAGSRSASASSHWAQQPTSWRAKPMKLACTHRVRHEEQRFTAL